MSVELAPVEFPARGLTENNPAVSDLLTRRFGGIGVTLWLERSTEEQWVIYEDRHVPQGLDPIVHDIKVPEGTHPLHTYKHTSGYIEKAA